MALQQKAAGAAQYVKGRAEQLAGRVTGRQQLTARGLKDIAAGAAKYGAGRAGERIAGR
jgi:uncharacterized protein YjbJ (UPF0337 family)